QLSPARVLAASQPDREDVSIRFPRHYRRWGSTAHSRPITKHIANGMASHQVGSNSTTVTSQRLNEVPPDVACTSREEPKLPIASRPMPAMINTTRITIPMTRRINASGLKNSFFLRSASSLGVLERHEGL